MLITTSYRPLILPRPIAQQGIATILIIVMIGLGMTVGALSAVYSVKGNQELQVAGHAQTHAQSGAWAGAEAFRRYLDKLSIESPQALASLSGDLPINMAGLGTSLLAHIVSSTAAVDGYDIVVNIRSEDQAAKSVSTLQVTYRVASASCSDTVNLKATLDFYDNLELSGDVDVHVTPGNDASFYVDGDVNMTSISVSGIHSLHATGDMTLGSGISLPEARTNGDLTLEGNASVGSASVIGRLTTSGNASVIDTAYVNDRITHSGGASGDLYSLSDIIMASWSGAGLLNAKGDISLNAGSSGNVEAKGDISVTEWLPSIGKIVSEMNVNCRTPSWPNYESIEAAGALNNCNGHKATAGASVNVSNMAILHPFSMEPITINAWPLKKDANYIFEWDGKIKVTVRNIHSIADGSYYIGRHAASGHQGFLCKETSPASNCIGEPIAKICNGHSAYNKCFNYIPATSEWSVDGKNMAPGVVWFEGDLTLGNGEYYNTFLVTGDINTAGAHKTMAINFAGYDVICDNKFLQNSLSNFMGLHPTNFCDKTTRSFISHSIGNIGLLAGGPHPSTNTYEGGNINLGASNVISGTVLAGNYFTSGGDTTVRGYITASALSGEGGNGNKLGASTTIDLSNLPSTYDPSSVTRMTPDGEACSSPNQNSTQTLWTRYL